MPLAPHFLAANQLDVCWYSISDAKQRVEHRYEHLLNKLPQVFIRQPLHACSHKRSAILCQLEKLLPLTLQFAVAFGTYVVGVQ